MGNNINEIKSVSIRSGYNGDDFANNIISIYIDYEFDDGSNSRQEIKMKKEIQPGFNSELLYRLVLYKAFKQNGIIIKKSLSLI